MPCLPRFLPFVAILLAIPPAHADGLAEALERAWSRTPQAQAEAARNDVFAARREAADALLPGAPVAGIGYRDASSDGGSREWEAEIEFPLWLPGQAAARRDQAGAERDGYGAENRALRLELAGRLRELAWQARLADNELETAGRRLAAAEALEADVARRVKVGDLARVDLLQARDETLVARSARLDAETRRAEIGRDYAGLTGDATLPAMTAEVLTKAPGEAPANVSTEVSTLHPRLAALEARIVAARAATALARASRRDNPDVALGLRREGGGSADPWRNSLNLRLRLPLANLARNRADLAASQADLAEAEAAARQWRERWPGEVAQARQAVAAAEARRELAVERKALGEENLNLARKAFDLGEIGLVARLRVQAAGNDAALELGRAEAALGLARARLNQTLGILP